jgi:hypothetical protein
VAGFDSAVKPLVSATRISGGSLRYGYVVQEIISDFAWHLPHVNLRDPAASVLFSKQMIRKTSDKVMLVDIKFDI